MNNASLKSKRNGHINIYKKKTPQVNSKLLEELIIPYEVMLRYSHRGKEKQVKFYPINFPIINLPVFSS